MTQRELPASGGIQGGVVGVPVVPQPGTQESPGASLLDKAALAGAQSLEQAGQLGVQTQELQLKQQELEAHRQRVFDTLNAKTEAMDIRDPFQALDAKLKAENWQTHPAELDKQGRAMIEERAKNLSPQAAVLFRHDAMQYLSQLHGRATDATAATTTQMTAFGLARKVQQAQEDYVHASTDYDRQVAMGSVQEHVEQLVAVGAMTGTAGATFLNETTKAFQAEQAKGAIQLNPTGMAKQITAQMTGQPTDPNLPLVPMEKASDFLKEARTVEEHQMARSEHFEQRYDQLIAKRQTENAADLATRMDIVVPTRENVGQYDTLLAEVDRRTQGPHPEIDYERGQQLRHQIRTMRLAALAPRETNDRATYDKIVLAFNAADNDQALERARQLAVESAGMLKADTFKSFVDEYHARKRSDYLYNLPGVRDGMNVIMGVEVGQSASVAALKANYSEQQQAAIRQAIEAYRAKIETIAGGEHGSKQQANDQGRMIGQEMYDRYVAPLDLESRANRVPREIWYRTSTPIPDLGEVKQKLSNLPGATEAEKARGLARWQGWWDRLTPEQRTQAITDYQQHKGGSAVPAPVQTPAKPPGVYRSPEELTQETGSLPRPYNRWTVPQGPFNAPSGAPSAPPQSGQPAVGAPDEYQIQKVNP